MRRTPMIWGIVGAGLIGVALIGATLADERGSRGVDAGGRDGAQALAEAHAARVAAAKLRARVDELELRLSVLESNTSYRALDGTVLPPVRDPAVPTSGEDARAIP